MRIWKWNYRIKSLMGRFYHFTYTYFEHLTLSNKVKIYIERTKLLPLYIKYNINKWKYWAYHSTRVSAIRFVHDWSSILSFIYKPQSSLRGL